MKQIKVKPYIPKSSGQRPEEIAWSIPIGTALQMFCAGACPKDFEHKNRVFESLCQAIEASPGANGRHVGMAVLDLARTVTLEYLTRSTIQEASTAGPVGKRPHLIVTSVKQRRRRQ
jgi:hypothetical protein